jgi:hypothetical protein
LFTKSAKRIVVKTLVLEPIAKIVFSSTLALLVLDSLP